MRRHPRGGRHLAYRQKCQDRLTGLIYAIRKQDRVERLHFRRGKVTAFAVGARAHVTGFHAVCSAFQGVLPVGVE